MPTALLWTLCSRSHNCPVLFSSELENIFYKSTSLAWPQSHLLNRISCHTFNMLFSNVHSNWSSNNSNFRIKGHFIAPKDLPFLTPIRWEPTLFLKIPREGYSTPFLSEMTLSKVQDKHNFRPINQQIVHCYSWHCERTCEGERNKTLSFPSRSCGQLKYKVNLS